MTRIAIAGANGRMGKCLIELAKHHDKLEIVAALTASNDPAIGDTAEPNSPHLVLTATLDTPCDVLIDFTAAGTQAWLEACVDRRLPMVIGATGQSPDLLTAIDRAAASIPIVKASNCSVGVNVLMGLVGQLAKTLGDAFDIELVETHHKHKIDAPSGTALSLLDEILAATGRNRQEHVIYGRSGHTGERAKGQIGVHSLRMGDVVGQHEIHFSGPGETIVVSHTAHSRDTFASGALRAATWLTKQSPGLYNMNDVLG